MLKDSEGVYYAAIFLDTASVNSVDILVNEIENEIKTHLDTIELLIISSKFKIIRYLYEPRFELEDLHRL